MVHLSRVLTTEEDQELAATIRRGLLDHRESPSFRPRPGAVATVTLPSGRLITPPSAVSAALKQTPTSIRLWPIFTARTSDLGTTLASPQLIGPALIKDLTIQFTIMNVEGEWGLYVIDTRADLGVTSPAPAPTDEPIFLSQRRAVTGQTVADSRPNTSYFNNVDIRPGWQTFPIGYLVARPRFHLLFVERGANVVNNVTFNGYVRIIEGIDPEEALNLV